MFEKLIINFYRNFDQLIDKVDEDVKVSRIWFILSGTVIDNYYTRNF